MSHGYLHLLCVLCSGTLILVSAQMHQNVHDRDSVSTPFGTLLGSTKRFGSDSYVASFFQIPYAKPPIGARRFQNPEAYGAWHGQRDARQMGAKCPQRFFPDGDTSPMSEDCLFLNIFTPKLPADGTKLPVMVWIHGGAYVVGTGNLFDGTQLALKGVVVVTINYRLDSLGFLSTQDGVSPGNYGLRDQIMALQWVRDAISAFSGDPDDVTIFGQSAGSGSVSLLLQSPLAKGLFHKAIMESGESLSDWAVAYPGLDPKIREGSKELARRVSCPDSDMTRMLSCLRTVDAMLITNTTAEMATDSGGTRLMFRPVVESTFGQTGVLAATPKRSLENGLFRNVTTIRGFCHDEAGGTLGPDDSNMTISEFWQKTEDFLRRNMEQSSFNVDLQAITNKLVQAYVNDDGLSQPQEFTATFIQLMSDYSMVAPTLHELELVTAQPVKPQYLYRFSYRSPNTQTEPWHGVVHGDDMVYVFGYPVMGVVPGYAFVSTWTDDDKRVSNDVMTMWTNFAKYGNPNGDSAVQKWLPWESASRSFLDIKDSMTSLRFDDAKLKKLNLWNDIVQQYLYGQADNGFAGVVG